MLVASLSQPHLSSPPPSLTPHIATSLISRPVSSTHQALAPALAPAGIGRSADWVRGEDTGVDTAGQEIVMVVTLLQLIICGVNVEI